MIERENKAAVRKANATAGVLAEGEVLLAEVVQGKRLLRTLPLALTGSQPDRLLEQLWQSGLNTIWVMPGSALSRTLTCGWFEQAGSAGSHWVTVVHPDQREPARPLSVLIWPRGGAQRETRLTLVFPEHAGWNWQLSDAMSLLATVTYLDQLLTRPLIDAPELVAHRLLAELSPEQLASSAVDLSALKGSDGTLLPFAEIAREVAWMRPLSWVEERQKYLHKYTHFSPYLEACKTVQLGGGAPQYSANGLAYDGIRPGIWRVSSEPAGSVFDGKGLPKCADEEWMCTPKVKCCREIGYRVQVREGYYWPHSQDALRYWAGTLWMAGEQLYSRPQLYRHVQARNNVSRTLKLLAQLSLSIIAQERAVGGWGRADWWAHIASASRANLFYHLARLVRSGVMPVLVHRDSFWVVSNDPSPSVAVPGLVHPQRWKGYIRGYEAPLPLTDNVRAVLKKAENAEQAAVVLDGLAGETFLS